jgi:hypothetical protein
MLGTMMRVFVRLLNLYFVFLVEHTQKREKRQHMEIEMQVLALVSHKKCV